MFQKKFQVKFKGFFKKLTSVANKIQLALGLDFKEAAMSIKGKSPQTSPFITKKASGFPNKIWSLK